MSRAGRRVTYGALAVLLGLGVFAPPASAQPTGSIRTTRPAVVMEQPRGDSLRLATVEAGAVFDVLAVSGSWYQVVAGDAAAAAKAGWRRGWVHAGSVEVIRPLPVAQAEAPAEARTPGRFRVRAFGQAGGTLFTARNSFEAILGNAFGAIAGGGVQVVLPNDVFVEVNVQRFRETGTRVAVVDGRLFTVGTETHVEVTPVLATVGFRSRDFRRIAPYVGFGLGWHELRETGGDAEDLSRRKIGYHVTGGVEYPLGRWLALAGEAQWATVPKALGDSGVSAAFGEKNLGGASFRFKVIVGN